MTKVSGKETLSGQVATYETSDGYVCRYRHYQATGPVRGRVVLVHGIQSHGGWYTRCSEALAAAGYEVDFLDRRGSGLNTEKRGDAPSFRRLVGDIAEFLGPQGNTPAHLICISWGGKLGLALEHLYPGRVKSLALLAPGICPKVGPGLGTRLAILASRIVAPGRLFAVPLADPALFTATPRWQDFIREDPLALRQATARFLVESVRLDIVLRRARRSVRAPLLLMLAGKDRIVNNARTRAFLESCPTINRRVIEYPEAHHTLEFEEDPRAVFVDLCRWLEDNTAG